jgi:hypothetical protein
MIGVVVKWVFEGHDRRPRRVIYFITHYLRSW